MKKSLFIALLMAAASPAALAIVGGTTHVDGCAASDPDPAEGSTTFYGVKTEEGEASGATVTLSIGEERYLVKSVYGGWADSGNAARNFVYAEGAISQGIPVDGKIVGGQSTSGEASGNTLVLYNVQGAHEGVYGGRSASGAANGNTVTVAGGNLDKVVGAYSDTVSSNNRIILVGGGPYIPDSKNTLGIDVPESLNPLRIFGKNMTLGEVRGFEGNSHPESSASLDVYGTGVSVQSIGNFTSVQFDLCPCLEPDMTILTINGDVDTDLTGVAVSLEPQWGIPHLEYGDQVTLIKTTGEGKLTGVDTESITFKKGRYEGFKGTVTLSEDATALILTVDYIGNNPVTSADAVKSVLETRAQATAMVNGGADFLMSNGIWHARHAAQDADRQDRGATAPFVAVGGSHMRHDTGSHIKGSGLNLATGFSGMVDGHAMGLAFEYGDSSYDSYVNDIHANGKGRSWGGALLGDWYLGAGWHMDTVGRVGKVRTTYNANLCGPVDFRTSSTYAGASIGFGHVQKAGAHGEFDTYLRYLYTRINGGNAHMNTGDSARFRSVNSNRTVLGTRYLYAVAENSRIYAGAGWMQQYGGGAHGTVDNVTGPSPSLNGASGFFELGTQLAYPDNHKLGFDFNVTGWVGTQRGVSVGAGIRYAF
ncbi:MAG: autotransporter outer membrane beta-barrel domain-containing protein [Akkermansia sp.]|nr:autotransporter outer membrane beta-barrel domain-containing protein [Akkermansia sp.]